MTPLRLHPRRRSELEYLATHTPSATERCRAQALLWEADYAGTSFLTPDKTGKLQFGSSICNFFADRTQPEGLATVVYDDEGVPGQRWYLVKDGLFVGWQTTRDLAPLIGQNKSYGCLHADSAVAAARCVCAGIR